MNLVRLKYFYHVARENGFSRASRVLRIAQPAVTRMVRNLEEELGVILFERNGNRVSLTPAGAALFRRCDVIFAEIDRARREIAPPRYTTRIEGKLLIGATDPFAVHLLAPLFKGLLAAYPDVRPSIVCAPAHDLCDKVSAGDLEAAWLFHLPMLEPVLEIKASFPTSFAVVTARGHVDAPEAPVIGSHSVDDPLAKTSASPDLFQSAGFSHEVTIATNNIATHRSLALSGTGVAVLPLFLIAEDLAAGSLVRLYPDIPITQPANLIGRKGEPLSAAAAAHLELAVPLLKTWTDSP